MTTQLDPEGLESEVLLQSVDFSRARVLEVGTGDGRLAFRYANAAAFVVGIEPQEKELVAGVAACAPNLQGRVGFVGATAFTLPFRKESFDIAVLAWSL